MRHPTRLLAAISISASLLTGTLIASAKQARPPPPPPPPAQPPAAPVASGAPQALRLRLLLRLQRALPLLRPRSPLRRPGVPPPWGYPGYYPPPYAGRSLDEEEVVRPYVEGAVIPPGYHVETRARKAPIIAGATMLGAGYLASAIAASAGVSDGDSELAPLFIPVVGPFITVGNLDFSGDFGGLALIVVGIPLILDGLLQTAGAITLIAGVSSDKKVLVYGPPVAMDTTPRVGIAGNRLVIEGRF